MKKGAWEKHSLVLEVWLVYFQHPEIHIQAKMKLYIQVRLLREPKISFVIGICNAKYDEDQLFVPQSKVSK